MASAQWTWNNDGGHIDPFQPSPITMPGDPQNPGSLGDDRTISEQREAPPESEQSLGDAGTHGGGLDSSISDLDHPGDALDFELPLIDLAARYDIEGELGKGGMGAVQLATDRSLQRKVAIKRIHASSPAAQIGRAHV